MPSVRGQRSLSPLAEALGHVLVGRSPTEAIRVGLAEGVGRYLAREVIAPEPLPRFANSAMDGYALRSGDLAERGTRLQVAASVMAGEEAATIGRGEAVRIMTGAALPEGADAVCVLEEARVDGREVFIPRALAVGANVRQVGEDVRAGSVLLGRGARLGAAELALLAALGIGELEVHRRPVVGVMSTGSELVGTGVTPKAGQIRDANRPGLLALAVAAGAEVLDLGIVADDADALAGALELAAGDCDVIVTSGGVGPGDRDYLVASLRRVAGEAMVREYQLAIRPARPFAFAELGEQSVPVFALVGNPVAALVAFELLVRPAIAKLAGANGPCALVLQAVATAPFQRRRDGKVHYVCAVVESNESASLVARPVAGQGAHMLRAMAMSNALVVLPDGEGAAVGDLVEAQLLAASVPERPLLNAEPSVPFPNGP